MVPHNRISEFYQQRRSLTEAVFEDDKELPNRNYSNQQSREATFFLLGLVIGFIASLVFFI